MCMCAGRAGLRLARILSFWAASRKYPRSVWGDSAQCPPRIQRNQSQGYSKRWRGSTWRGLCCVYNRCRWRFRCKGIVFGLYMFSSIRKCTLFPACSVGKFDHLFCEVGCYEHDRRGLYRLSLIEQSKMPYLFRAHAGFRTYPIILYLAIRWNVACKYVI